MLKGSPVLTEESVPDASITIRARYFDPPAAREHAYAGHGAALYDRGLHAGLEHDTGAGVHGVFLHAVDKEGELHHVEGVAHRLGAVPVRRPRQSLGIVADQLAALRHRYAVLCEPYLVHVENADVSAEHPAPFTIDDDDGMARLCELPPGIRAGRSGTDDDDIRVLAFLHGTPPEGELPAAAFSIGKPEPPADHRLFSGYCQELIAFPRPDRTRPVRRPPARERRLPRRAQTQG